MKMESMKMAHEMTEKTRCSDCGHLIAQDHSFHNGRTRRAFVFTRFGYCRCGCKSYFGREIPLELRDENWQKNV